MLELHNKAKSSYIEARVNNQTVGGCRFDKDVGVIYDYWAEPAYATAFLQALINLRDCENSALNCACEWVHTDMYGIVYRKSSLEELPEVIELLDNTKDTLLRTFKTLWVERGYISKYPPVIARRGGQLVGVHAYTLNEKYPDTCKSYYHAVAQGHRRLGIGKNLVLYAFIDANMHGIAKYYVNCAETTDGWLFYRGLGLDSTTKQNEFGTRDYCFAFDIKGMLTLKLFQKKIEQRA